MTTQKHLLEDPTLKPMATECEGELPCICKGNWRSIVDKAEPLIYRKYQRLRDGAIFEFFGVVHGSDDYYYGMWSKEHGLVLLSCVGNIDDDYELI